MLSGCCTFERRTGVSAVFEDSLVVVAIVVIGRVGWFHSGSSALVVMLAALVAMLTCRIHPCCKQPPV
jgi:hypothetical protein